MRFCRSAVPGLVTALNLPRWCGRDRAAEGRQRGSRPLRLCGVGKEAVEGRAGTADVGSKRSKLDESRRERRRGEIVWGQRNQLTCRERVEDLFSALVETRFLLEAGI